MCPKSCVPLLRATAPSGISVKTIHVLWAIHQGRSLRFVTVAEPQGEVYLMLLLRLARGAVRIGLFPASRVA